MAEPTINPQRFQVVHAEIEGRHRIIAALKVQRWEVLKWAVAINVGLITAWVALGKQPTVIFTILSGLVAAAAISLLWHYSKRAMGARGDLLVQFALLKPVVEYGELRMPKTRERMEKRTLFHDIWELVIFSGIIISTVLVTYAITTRWAVSL